MIISESMQTIVAKSPRQIIVAAAIIDETDRVLISQRKADTRYGGLWEFPGGKVKDHETLAEGIIREVYEEIGLNVQENCLAPICFVHETEGNQEFLILLYAVRIWEGKPTANEKQPIVWVKKSALGSYPMPPINQHLLAMLRDIL